MSTSLGIRLLIVAVLMDNVFVVVQMDIYSKYFPCIKVDEAIKIQGRNSRFSETGLRPFIYLRNLDFSSMFTPHDSSQITLPNIFIKTELKLSFQ